MEVMLVAALDAQVMEVVEFEVPEHEVTDVVVVEVVEDMEIMLVEALTAEAKEVVEVEASSFTHYCKHEIYIISCPRTIPCTHACTHTDNKPNASRRVAPTLEALELELLEEPEPPVPEVLVLEVQELLELVVLQALEHETLELELLEVLDPQVPAVLVLEVLELLELVVLRELELETLELETPELEALALGVLVLLVLILETLDSRDHSSFLCFGRFLSLPTLQPAYPMPAPSPYTEHTGGLTERREPVSCPASLVRAVHTGRRVPRPRPPPVPSTHHMALSPSSVPQRVPVPSPPASSLADRPDPESDLVRAASPIVPPLLATVVTDPSFESAMASALVAKLVDFVTAYRLDYAASLVVES
ncbi:unnamed protein product [Closterium sp. NIES-53]